MMRRFGLLLFVCCLAMYICAQPDPVLLRINDEEITRAAFEHIYNERNPSGIYDKEHIREFFDQFVYEKLCIAEARALGLDTLMEFHTKMSVFRNNLSMHYLAMSGLDEHIHAYAQQQKSGPYFAKPLVMQIFRYIPQNSPSHKQEEINQFMKSLHAQLVQEPSADFGEYVEAYSDDKRSFEVRWLETSLEFEQIVYAMREGEISSPFFTPQGIHIVKVLAIENELKPDELQEEFRIREMKKYKSGSSLAILEGLKEKYAYTPNQQNMDKLLSTGQADENVLFSFNGKAYTGSDFQVFAAVDPKGIKLQLNDFINKVIFDTERELLDLDQSDHDMRIKAYEDEILYSEVIRREIQDKARTDQAGLSAYFSVHKKKYRWDQPRFRGAVLHTQDKKMASLVKKVLKKKPVEEWGKTVDQLFNTFATSPVKMETGLFAKGDNEFIDGYIFKKRKPDPLPSYPFTTTIGKKVKGPDHYKEVLEPLIDDYEKFLKSHWISKLQKTYRVEINEEVLKTVNNH